MVHQAVLVEVEVMVTPEVIPVEVIQEVAMKIPAVVLLQWTPKKEEE
jgi:hypothetical protein